MSKGREIEIPLIGLTTWVSDTATEKEIIEAVSEASVAFCLASVRHGEGIEKELEYSEKERKEKMKRKR